MADYLCRHNTGPYFKASDLLAHQLDEEAVRCPVNVSYAMTIRTGTGSDLSNGRGPDTLYRWAQVDGWRVITYPHAGGGSQAFVNVDGIGFVVDVNDDMPHEVYVILLQELGAPVLTY